MKMIDRLAVKEQILYSYPFSKDIFTHSDGFSFKKLCFNYNGMSIDEAVHRMDEVFTKIMFEIKDSYTDDTVYGLGLSGGMDSRVVLHYALKAGIKVNCYIIGDVRPHILFLSKDHKNAVRICKLYNIKKLRFVEPIDWKYWKENFIKNCKEHPFKPFGGFGPLLNKADVPKFDVLLSGTAGGESMGQTLPDNILELNHNQITFSIFKRLSKLAPYKHGSLQTSIDGVVSQYEFKQIFDKIYGFIKSFDSDNIGAFQSILYYFLNRSLSVNTWGLPRHYLFYHKDYHREFSKWNPEWLIGCKIQKHFFNTILPDLAKISNQRWMVPYYYQDKSFRKLRDLWYLGDFVLRWHALRYHHWFNRIKKSRFAKEILLKPNPLFDEFFDTFIADMFYL